MGNFFRPPPASVSELAQLIVETFDGIADTKREISDRLSEQVFRSAAYAMGVVIDGEVTVENIGFALGKKIENETGVKLGNVLDGESVKVKLERIAIGELLREFEIDAPATRDGLAMAVGVLMRRKIKQKIESGEAVGLLDAVGSMREAGAVLAAIKAREVPLLTGEKARQNRERQAKYRSTHRRVRT